MHVRMPGSILQASQGGTCPRTSLNIPVTNHHEFEEHERESQEDDIKEDATWVPGGNEEDNKRYMEFLEYCEERRQEAKRFRNENEARKSKANCKEEAWYLMRTSIEFLKSNEDK